MTINFFAKADKADKPALTFLFEHKELIFNNSELILKTPEYYNIFIKGCGIFPLYVQSNLLSLGNLIQLWNVPKAKWLQDNKYFYSITGSPLSGGNSSAFWSEKDGFSFKQTNTFLSQIRSAQDVFHHGEVIMDNSPINTELTKQTPSDLTIYDLVKLLS